MRLFPLAFVINHVRGENINDGSGGGGGRERKGSYVLVPRFPFWAWRKKEGGKQLPPVKIEFLIRSKREEKVLYASVRPFSSFLSRFFTSLPPFLSSFNQ